MRILHCPATVGGNPQGLSRAERGAGHRSESWTLTQNRYAYPADRVICRSGRKSARAILRWWAIARMLRGFDVVHFNFGQSFSPLRIPSDQPGWRGWLAGAYNRVWAGPWELADVAWVRRLGAVVAVTYQGDDARQGDYCRANYRDHFVHEVPPGYYTDETDRQKRERIRYFDRHADLIYALNPDLLRVLPARARFLPYASVDPQEWRAAPGARRGNPDRPLVVHAPSNRWVKGTKYLLAAVEQLQREGVPFQFALVENMAHADARELYASADLAVDQLLAGFYGAFAVELMAAAKPVICRIRAEDLPRLPAAMAQDLPLIEADADSICAVLREWLTVRKSEVAARGVRSRAFVEKWHDPRAIARGLIADYAAARTARAAAARPDFPRGAAERERDAV